VTEGSCTVGFRPWGEDRAVEGPAVGHRVVDLAEVESGDVFGGEVQGARRDEPDHAGVRRALGCMHWPRTVTELRMIQG
jgi:hypothetical protein